MNMSYMGIPGIPRTESEIALTVDQQQRLIVSAVCNYYGVTEAGIKSKIRERVVSDARHVTMYFLCDMLPLGVSSVGDKFGKDHTTVIFARKKIKNLLFSDKVFRLQMQFLKNNIEKDITTYKKNLVDSKKQLLS